MLKNDDEYKKKVYDNLDIIKNNMTIPQEHILYLDAVRHNEKRMNREIKTIYDIGSSCLHWTIQAKQIFKNANIICFDAFEPAEELYKKNNIENYYIGLLGDNDDEEVKFYQNDFLIGGNSIYRENTEHFPEDNYLLKKKNKLDSVVQYNNFDYADLIKIDVQGAELDILKGALNVLESCKYLVIELQHEEYNIGAPKINDTMDFLNSVGFKLISKMFNNGVDGDYLFYKP